MIGTHRPDRVICIAFVYIYSFVFCQRARAFITATVNGWPLVNLASAGKS